MRVGIASSFGESLVFGDKDVYPVRIAGDILQAYWIVKNLRDKVDFVRLEEESKIKHFFFFDLALFSSFNFGDICGFNPNFFDFIYYNTFTSSSIIDKIFLNFFPSLLISLKKILFLNKNRRLIQNFREVVENNRIRYFIVNSFWEKFNLIEFLKFLNINLDRIDFFVIPNPFDYKEIDYLLSWSDYKLPSNIPSGYVLILSRFDRIKNIVPFVIEYKRSGIGKFLPLLVVGTVQEYDVSYYKYLTQLQDNSVKVVNINDFKFNYIGKDRYFFYRFLALNFIRNSHVVVIPSLVESFGFVGFEALYLNKPVIITKNSPYSEFFGEYIDKSIKLIDPLKLILDRELFSFDNYVNLDKFIIDCFGAERIANKYLEVWRRYA